MVMSLVHLNTIYSTSIFELWSILMNLIKIMYFHRDNFCCKNLEKICQKLVDKSGSAFVVYRSKLSPRRRSLVQVVTDGNYKVEAEKLNEPCFK